MTEMSRRPDFLYVGTSKAGSTWLYGALEQHPEIYMAPGKSLHYFSNRYDEGTDWYLRHFQAARQERVLGEVSHGYLYSEDAPGRIAELNPSMKILICVREPVARAFSDYLDGIKNGQIEGSFEEQLDRSPSFLERSRYSSYIERYLDVFGEENVHVAIFEELAANPDLFAGKIFRFLGVEEQTLTQAQRKKMMPAGKPRSQSAAQMAKQASQLAKRLGLRRLRGKVKTSRTVRNILYAPYTDENKPRMRPETQTRLRQSFQPEVAKLDSLLSTNLRQTWNY